MKEAQRFPDFDGIIAGAPGSIGHARGAGGAGREDAREERGGAFAAARTGTASSSRARRVRHARWCEGRAHLDPERCTFDPAMLKCKDSEQRRMSVGGTVETARFIYASPTNPKNRAPDHRSDARQRAGVDRHRLDGIGASDRP